MAIVRPDGSWRDVLGSKEHPAQTQQHPVRAAVRELHQRMRVSAESPLVVFAEPGRYRQDAPFMVGGGWGGVNGPDTISLPGGEPLYLALQGVPGKARPIFSALSIQDGVNPVDVLRCADVAFKNHPDLRAPIMMICSDDSTGDLSFQDFTLLPSDNEAMYGGWKWATHWSHASRSLLIRAMDTSAGSPWEHDIYGNPRRGPFQVSKTKSDGGNRTFGQWTWYDGQYAPGAPILLEDVEIDDQGQAWPFYNGGSAITLWGNPNHMEVTRRCRVRDTKYGAFTLTCNPRSDISGLWKGKWHHRHYIMDDCEWDNVTDDPGEVDGDRAAVALHGSEVVEFKTRVIITGQLSLGSEWSAKNIKGANLVKEYRFSRGLVFELHGPLLRWNPLTWKTEVVATPERGKPLTLPDLLPHFREAEKLAAATLE